MNELFFPPDIVFTVQDHQHISIVVKNLLDVKGKIRIKRIADVADNQRNDALSALAQTSGYCIWLITYLLHKIQHLFAQLPPTPGELFMALEIVERDTPSIWATSEMVYLSFFWILILLLPYLL